MPDELVRHLANCSPLTTVEAERLATEVIHYFACTLPEFVAQWHQELQKAGLPNPEIYRVIEQEITERVFSAAPISIRQIRRLIYG